MLVIYNIRSALPSSLDLLPCTCEVLTSASSMSTTWAYNHLYRLLAYGHDIGPMLRTNCSQEFLPHRRVLLEHSPPVYGHDIGTEARVSEAHYIR